MILINGKKYKGNVIYCANTRGDVSATFTGGLSDEDISNVLNAKEIAELANDTGETLSIYSLVKWRGMEKSGNNLVVLWQTYIHDDIEQIKQDNEDLTQAVLELAQIVGGEANG